jgi:antitoxin YefM
MKIISFSEARNSLKTVLDQVTEDADYTIITRRDFVVICTKMLFMP